MTKLQRNIFLHILNINFIKQIIFLYEFDSITKIFNQIFLKNSIPVTGVIS